MGGKGSGRLTKTDAFLKKNSAPFNTVSSHVASIGNEVLVIPNHSGAHNNLDVRGETVLQESLTLMAGVPTLIFDDTHATHDKYRIRVDNDKLCFGAGAPIGDMFCLDLATNDFNIKTSTLTIDGYPQGAVAFGGPNNTVIGNVNKLLWDNTNFNLRVEGDYVVSKVSGMGIKVDTTTPTFGWRDLLGEIRTRGVGATDPNDATYRDTVKGFQFAVNDEAFINFHLPHDYVKGTDIFLHFHWSHNSTLVTGGSVIWGIEATYAKGHNQAAFPASVTRIVTATASTTQYQHLIDELQLSISGGSATQIDTDDLEPDGVIICRVSLGANNITSSGAVPDPFLHFADIHYQSTNVGTKDKVPDFYT